MKDKLVELLPTFDPSEVLDTPESISLFLSSAMEEGDPNVVITALGYVARSYGMTQLSKQTGISREVLYKTLKNGNNTSFKTILKVVNALGYSLTLKPNHIRMQEERKL